MLKDISLGQYFPGNSLLHKTDGRIKIIILALFIVAVLSADAAASFIYVFLMTLVFIFLSRIPLSTVLRNLRPLVMVLLFTALLNLFFVKGENLVWQYKFIKIYSEGISFAVFMVIRLICLVCGSFIIVSYTTSPIDLTDSIESLFSPLKKIKVPVHDFAMMMTIALRFIPTLMEETDKIISAQKARGADFESGGIFKRIKALIPILIPLFVSAFRRADELAQAMECRCYRGGDGRTRMKIMKITATDIVFLTAMIIACAAVFFINHIDLF